MAIPRVPGRDGRRSRWLVAAMAASSLGMASWVARAQDPGPPPDPTPVGQGAEPQQGQAPAQGAEADASGGQVLTQGPVHEAFATPVVHDPKAAPVVTKQPPDPIQEVRAGPEAVGPEHPVDPRLLGLGSDPQRLPVGQRRLARAAAGHAVGPGLLAHRRRRIPVGVGLVDAGEHRAGPGDGPGIGAGPGDLHAPASGEPRGRTKFAATRAQRRLDPGLLDLARRRIRLAARVLGGRPAQLDLDAAALRLDAQRLPVRPRLLGPAGGQPRADVRPCVLSPAGLRPARLRLHAVDQHRRLGRDLEPLRLRRHQPVPLRELLRPGQRQHGHRPVVLVQLRGRPAGLL